MFIPALICGVIFTSFGSIKAEPKEAVGKVYEESEWWQPILEKFNLKLGAYNNFDNVFVMGMEENSINDGICTLKTATVLIKCEDGRYLFLEADSVIYYIEDRIFDFMPVAKRAYTLNAEFNESSSVHGEIAGLKLLNAGATEVALRAVSTRQR